MTTQSFLIGPVGDGLRKDVKPFATPEDSFTVLTNAYQWRGRVVRRSGYTTLGRLTQIIDDGDLGTSGASPWTFNIYSTLSPALTNVTFAEIVIGSVEINMNPATTTGAITGYTNATNCEVTAPLHGLITGDRVSISGVVIDSATGDNLINGGPYTITVTSPNTFQINQNSSGWGTYVSGGTWTQVVGAIQLLDQGDGTLATSPASANVGTINYYTGNVTITYGGGAVAVTIDFSYYPTLPVMGLPTKEGFNIDIQSLIAFDTRYSYEFNGNDFVPLASTMPVIWNGTNFDFFRTASYAEALWVTNFVPGLHGWNVQSFSNAAGLGPTATVDVTAAGNNVAVGDFVYFLNLTGTAAANNLIYAEVVGIVTPGVKFTVQYAIDPPDATFTFATGAVNSGFVLDSQKTLPGLDGIRYYGVLQTGAGWANYNPPLNTTTALAGALLIFPYRGYLVFLNTWEGSDNNNLINYGNRARWTQIGTPYYSAPVPQNPSLQGIDINAARDDLFGRGGANDAPTNEVIVGANFIRDILIVYFERSTWRLRFVNNAQNPFVWERVNIELGASCTGSTIPFDKGLIAISNRGIVISDGNDTIRIDDKIPDDFFDIRESENGLKRVNGIRTFRTKLNYWTFPSTDKDDGIYPDKVLVLNYDTKNWSYFDDSFTVFGYYYPTGAGYTWDDLDLAWSSYTFISWNSGISEALAENIVAGNQQGYVLTLEETNGENTRSLTIRNITDSSVTLANAVLTSPNNNLSSGDWITLSGIIGTTSDDGVSLNGRNFRIADPTLNADDFFFEEFEPITDTASGATYSNAANPIVWQSLIPGSAQINVGAIVLTDPDSNGVLVANSGATGTIDYSTGVINITFSPAIGSTPIYIRVVSQDPTQQIQKVNTLGTYIGGGQIAKISNIDIQTKYFNFFNDDKRSRLSKIDFYVDETSDGQFTCNIFADSSNVPVNTPLSDNPISNVVLTSVNPYQIGQGDQTIYRLYCDALAQSIQLQLTLSDAQIAVNAINKSNIEISGMIFTLRRGGRLV